MYNMSIYTIDGSVYVQENFSKGGRAGIFDLYPVVLYLSFCTLFSYTFWRSIREGLPRNTANFGNHTCRIGRVTTCTTPF